MKNEIKQRATKKYYFAILAVLLFIAGAEIFLRFIPFKKIDPAKLDSNGKLSDFVSFLEWDINIEARKGDSFYVEDPDLLWRLRPGFEGMARDFFVMTVTDHAPRWHIKINEQGFRGPTFRTKADAGAYRVLCLGDSSMFGFGVDDGDSFPASLQSELDRMCPSCRFEVINMGVPGYTSRQGVELAKKWIPALNPNMVIVGYGTNDWWHRETTDDEAMKYNHSAGAKISRFINNFEIVKMFSKLLAQQSRETSGTILPNRVSRVDCEKNIAAIAQLSLEQGARVLLMSINFYVPYASQALINISKAHPEYEYFNPLKILANALRDVETLKKEYPVDCALSERVYNAVIARRPIFYLMVDPVHPNALGHRLIASDCARNILNPPTQKQLFDTMNKTIENLPAAQAMGAPMADRTALEELLLETAETNIR